MTYQEKAAPSANATVTIRGYETWGQIQPTDRIVNKANVLALIEDRRNAVQMVATREGREFLANTPIRYMGVKMTALHLPVFIRDYEIALKLVVSSLAASQEKSTEKTIDKIMDGYGTSVLEYIRDANALLITHQEMEAIKGILRK